MQQAHGDGLDRRLAQRGRDVSRIGVVERHQHLAVCGHPLADLEAQAPRDERVGLSPERLVHPRDPQAPQLENVAEAGRRDERRQCAALLEHRVRRDRRAVDDAREGGAGREPAPALTTATS